MRWKQNVQLICESDIYVNDNGKKIPIIKEDVYIINSLIEKEQTDTELIKLVMENESMDEISANWRMAEFVEKYGQWIDCVEDNVVFPV